MQAGPGGRTSQATQQRVKVQWETLRLAESTPGYAATAKPLDEIIQAAVSARATVRKPILIWICDAEDEKGNDQLEKKIFNDEKVGLSLKRFICLRGEIQTLPDDKQAQKLFRKAPLFYFYDPAGKAFGKPLYGKRATSKSGFCRQLEKLWNVSFEMKLKDYSKQMGKILDKMDKLEAEKSRLTDKMDRAADNPRKLAVLKKEEDKLQAEEDKITAEEKEIVDAVALKDEYLPKDENAAK